ncbi:MAG: glutamine amidotransferase [Gemmataceae bacterium]
MNYVLDPVWPWSRLWEVVSQISPAVQGVAVLAALLALVLPIAVLGRARPAWRLGLLSALAMALLLVSQHTWSLVYAGCRGVTGSAWYAFPLALVAHLGLFLLLIGPSLLAGLSVGAYLGTPRVGWLRLTLVAGLRLLAFVLTMIALARPSFGWVKQEQTLSQLFLLLDASRSMTVQDERGKESRWDLATRTLTGVEPLLTRLRDEQQVDVQIFRYGDELQEATLQTLGAPTGPRTDLGAALRTLLDRRDPRLTVRGVLVLGDGADNGGTPALAEAMRWRAAGPTITTFASGNPGTTPRQNDVAITSITTSPRPFVPIKGKLGVRLQVDARGYENSRARVRLFLDSDGQEREVLARDVNLPLTTGNEVALEVDAPDKPGEVKVRAVVELAEPDDLPLNNTIETFVTISREGISVLLVDRQRAYEPQFLCDALLQEARRIRLTPVWVRGGRPARGTLFGNQPYDVIILGDVTADQLRAIDPDALNRIEQQVTRGAGLLVLGGYVNLGNGGWKGTPLEKLLPVDLNEREQVDRPVKMVPTEDGLRRARYLLRLDDNPDLKQAWERLARLDGMTVLRLPEPRRGLETVLATSDDGRPLLVFQPFGAKKETDSNAARVVVFGGDTTYRWVRNEEGQKLHERFWQQMVIWLARQEDSEGSVWIRADERRLRVGSDLGVSVGIRSKGGGPDIRDGTFDVEVTAPDGTTSKVPLLRSASQTRGIIPAARQPGIYRVRVRGEGKDPSGGLIQGESSVRVIVYDEDLELTQPAADPEFLKKLASAAGGEALRIEQLGEYLSRLAEEPLDQGKPTLELRPDWRTTERSSFFVSFFVAFCAVLCTEWGLRRRWGLV